LTPIQNDLDSLIENYLGNSDHSSRIQKLKLLKQGTRVQPTLSGVRFGYDSSIWDPFRKKMVEYGVGLFDEEDEDELLFVLGRSSFVNSLGISLQDTNYEDFFKSRVKQKEIDEQQRQLEQRKIEGQALAHCLEQPQTSAQGNTPLISDTLNAVYSLLGSSRKYAGPKVHQD
jgi:hypothetical protein